MRKNTTIFVIYVCKLQQRVCSLTCMVSSPWRSCSRLTMVCSLWARTLVFLSLVLSSRLFSRGFMRLASMEGVAGSLNTHHNTRSDTSLMSLDWFWRPCGGGECHTDNRRHNTNKTSIYEQALVYIHSGIIHTDIALSLHLQLQRVYNWILCEKWPWYLEFGLFSLWTMSLNLLIY